MDSLLMTALVCTKKTLTWIWIATVIPAPFAAWLAFRFFHDGRANGLVLAIAIAVTWASTWKLYREIGNDAAMPPALKEKMRNRLRLFGPAATIDMLAQVYRQPASPRPEKGVSSDRTRS
jgi:hypothetical protein